MTFTTAILLKSLDFYTSWKSFMLDDKQVQDLLYHGTTTVGLVSKDAVVFAADMRASAGYYIAHKNVQKILKIDDHMAMTISGVVADAQTVVDTLRYQARLYRLNKKTLMPIQAAARMTSNLLFSTRIYPLIVIALVGGVDESGPNVYNIDFFGSLSKEKYVSTGSGSLVAYGILESEYREDLKTEEMVKVAAEAVAAAIKRNAGTGDGINVTVVDKNGYRELSEDDKLKVLSKPIVK